jgi:hypothetical protein
MENKGVNTIIEETKNEKLFISSFMTHNEESEAWYIDSGCSTHMTSQEELLFIVYYTINVDILITLHFYICRWNMKRKNKEFKPINKECPITQVQYPLQVMKK